MKNIHEILADRLLKCQAVKFRSNPPFQWASGWKSPVYCDNRITLSYPDVRNFIKYSFAGLIKEKYLSTEVIAGVATGAIAHGVLVADLLGLPFVYIRPAPKSHGLGNLIEGHLAPGSKVVVIEDLISTGGSSLKAVEALRSAGSEVLGMAAVFTYGFDVAEKAFSEAKCSLFTLSNYETLLQQGIENGYIRNEELDILREWRNNPSEWDVK